MKNILYLVALILVLVSCGGGSDGPAENSAPTTPILKSPENEMVSNLTKVLFHWEASTDSDGDDISYSLQIAKNEQFSTGLKNISSITKTSIEVNLEEATAYYWRVKAKDSQNEESAFSSANIVYTKGYRVGNQLPSVPTLKNPTDNFICSVSNVDFEWFAATDGDGDAITYTIEIASDEQFKTVVQSISDISALTKQVALERASTFYWRVKAVDALNGASAFSSKFKFYTEGYGVENHLPKTAGLIFPELSSTVNGNSVILKWTAEDQDVDDILSYDVYVGTTNPPIEKKGADLDKKEFEFTPLISNTTYYWKVVVKDNHEGASIGKVWDFKTE